MDCKLKVDKRATGLKIYRLLESSELSREEIAEFLELTSPRVIYDWVNGTKLPSTENLLNLAKLLNVQIEDILAI
ncbi:MAG: helix-turn-helix domain-containing protein [Clostridia bacterium]|nr:helix-turn-helix domain-containing protein [Clostridia bacterium]